MTYTRAGMVQHFGGATWHYPDAVFALSKLEIEDEIAGAEHFGPGTDQDAPDDEGESHTEQVSEGHEGSGEDDFADLPASAD
jgi:hypothetical protein